jgi:sialic acid synthase SpsE
VVRKRLHAARDLAAGTRLNADDLLALRAEHGIPVSQFDAVIGRQLKHALSTGASIAMEDLHG